MNEPLCDYGYRGIDSYAGYTSTGERVTVVVKHGSVNYEKTEWFYLPHQCDSWVIGNADQARLLIADLQALIIEEEEGST